MAKVVLDHIWKRYGDVVAVNDVSLEAKDQEFLVLVGPSGCGKTTSLRMVAGLEDISEGTIQIGDRVVNNLSPKDRDIAMVFQSYALYPHMNVYKNMAFGLEMRKTPKPEIKRRVREAAEILGITPYLDRKPKALSGGQRQRVALGRAIVREPAVFLMDEPLSNLDAQLRVQTRADLVKLHQRLRTTVIYVTHDQIEAMTMGDRIAVMKDGFLQQADRPKNLYDFPVNAFVAGFIGSPSMNLLDGTLSESDGTFKVTGDGYSINLTGPIVGAVREKPSPEVILGVRPEHILLSEQGDGAAENGSNNSIPVVIDVVENLGNEVLAYIKQSNKTLTARFSADAALTPGQTIKVMYDSDNLHLFNRATGEAIGHARSADT